jgi:hypothetical protein
MNVNWALPAFGGLLLISLVTVTSPLTERSTRAQTGGAPVVAVDADATDNGPRTVGTVESCVTAEVGQPVTVDILLPAPGIPAERGISGYEFTLYYDSQLLRMEAEDPNQLLVQAGGSRLIPITGPLPDSTGSHFSVGLDFGTRGIEPNGASETGPGVITRITVDPVREGVSALDLQGVIIVDDDSQKIEVPNPVDAMIAVGEACQQATPSPAPPAPASQPSTPAPRPATPSATKSVSPAALAETGGPPGAADSGAATFVVVGVAALFSGATALAAAARSSVRRKTR